MDNDRAKVYATFNVKFDSLTDCFTFVIFTRDRTFALRFGISYRGQKMSCEEVEFRGGRWEHKFAALQKNENLNEDCFTDPVALQGTFLRIIKYYGRNIEDFAEKYFTRKNCLALFSILIKDANERGLFERYRYPFVAPYEEQYEEQDESSTAGAAAGNNSSSSRQNSSTGRDKADSDSNADNDRRFEEFKKRVKAEYKASGSQYSSASGSQGSGSDGSSSAGSRTSSGSTEAGSEDNPFAKYAEHYSSASAGSPGGFVNFVFPRGIKIGRGQLWVRIIVINIVLVMLCAILGPLKAVMLPLVMITSMISLFMNCMARLKDLQWSGWFIVLLFLPLFNWILFPVAGIFFGEYYIRCNDKKKLLCLWPAGLVISIIYFVTSWTRPEGFLSETHHYYFMPGLRNFVGNIGLGLHIGNSQGKNIVDIAQYLGSLVGRT